MALRWSADCLKILSLDCGPTIEEKLLRNMRKTSFDKNIRSLFESETQYFNYVDNSNYDTCYYY